MQSSSLTSSAITLTPAKAFRMKINMEGQLPGAKPRRFLGLPNNGQRGEGRAVFEQAHWFLEAQGQNGFGETGDRGREAGR